MRNLFVAILLYMTPYNMRNLINTYQHKYKQIKDITT